jgi:N-acetyl-anhydromuramyl-L-alanine amidase AmpD
MILGPADDPGRCRLAGPRPADSLAQCRRASRRHGNRPAGRHHISLPPGRFGGDAIERLFTNRLDPHEDPSFQSLQGLRVSAHFLIRRRGGLLQFVSTRRRAWHAGVSRLGTRERLQRLLDRHRARGDGTHRFTPAQYASPWPR